MVFRCSLRRTVAGTVKRFGETCRPSEEGGEARPYDRPEAATGTPRGRGQRGPLEHGGHMECESGGRGEIEQIKRRSSRARGGRGRGGGREREAERGREGEREDVQGFVSPLKGQWGVSLRQILQLIGGEGYLQIAGPEQRRTGTQPLGPDRHIPKRGLGALHRPVEGPAQLPTPALECHKAPDDVAERPLRLREGGGGPHPGPTPVQCRAVAGVAPGIGVIAAALPRRGGPGGAAPAHGHRIPAEEPDLEVVAPLVHCESAAAVDAVDLRQDDRGFGRGLGCLGLGGHVEGRRGIGALDVPSEQQLIAAAAAMTGSR